MARGLHYRPRRRRGIPILPSVLVIFALGASAWWLMPDAEPELDTNDQLAAARAPLTTDRPEPAAVENPRPEVTEKGENPEPAVSAQPEAADGQVKSLIKAGEQALARDDLLTARTHFSDAVGAGASGGDLAKLRAELTRIGNETVFSPRLFDGDPLVSRYTIQVGDTLGKIAKANKVSPELIASINGIRNVNLIRAGQVLKVLHGPFHAVVHKGDYSLDVYLGNVFVKHFKVGLGADGSTPTGNWVVGTKLKNPTYYPPRGGDIIAADDPKNPLGERWIALVGVGGTAVGQQRYGIHGTIEPESVGKSMSLGCVRMYNEDVELLYNYLVQKHSTVRIVD